MAKYTPHSDQDRQAMLSSIGVSSIEDLFADVRRAWAESVKGYSVDGRPMIALDVDEPLWHLSKFGCGRRNPETGVCPLRGTCELGVFCVDGRVSINGQTVALDTPAGR